MAFTVSKAATWLRKFDNKIQNDKDLLTELDREIGDGDHGINMSRGMKETMKMLESKSFDDVGSLIKAAATTMISKVGGASGPLYGSAFMKMAAQAGSNDQITEQELIAALKEGEKAIIQRGKASTGEKTMVDVWTPLLAEFTSRDKVPWDEFKATAYESMQATKDMQAKKGRAAYLEARSVGHIDPGSMSSYLLFASLAETMMEEE